MGAQIRQPNPMTVAGMARSLRPNPEFRGPGDTGRVPAAMRPAIRIARTVALRCMCASGVAGMFRQVFGIGGFEGRSELLATSNVDT